MEAGAGNDIVNVGDGDNTVLGGEGNDQITTGSGIDWIEGGSGNDVILAGDGDNFILGEDGDDQITTGSGNDRIQGGAGADTIDAAAGDDRIEGDAGNDVITVISGMNLIWGGADHDTITGGTDVDRIDGGEGNDTIDAADGDDQVWGREGNDILVGGFGNDRLLAGAGVDWIEGNAGDDYIDAQGGIGNVIFGGTGVDTIHGSDEGAASDPDFSDTIYFGDQIDAGDGDDQIWGLGGADLILGGLGNDWIDAGAHADRVEAGDGDDWVYVGASSGDQAYGEAGYDTLYGSHVGSDYLSGGDGHDRLFGQGGVDLLEGGTGNDLLDGGADQDTLRGGDGDDELLGGGGVGDRLEGEAGDDVLRGSDDGADLLFGGTGREVILAGAGNDFLSGGDGDDVLQGGEGDDTIEGDAGSDLLLGETHHDTLYGHSATGIGDDGAVDWLYGDFGTDQDEVGSGRDRLFAGLGDDYVFGEGEDDYIEPDAGDWAYFGPGESAVENDFVTPTATAAPAVQPGTPLIVATASLPSGLDRGFRWRDLNGSASGMGLSGDEAQSIEPDVAANSDGGYYAWVDARSGSDQIYVAQYTAGGDWQQLGGSAEQDGISLSNASSRRPSIAVDLTGRPIVAWTEQTSTGSDIHVLVWDQGLSQWIALGTSTTSGGISQTGTADSAQIVITADGPIVAWLDGAGGTANVVARRFDGSNWVEMAGSATVSGISGSATDVTSFAMATDGTSVAVAWAEGSDEAREIFLKEYSGTAWGELAGSASGTGVSDTLLAGTAPSVAYHQGELFVAWQEHVSDLDVAQAIYVKRFNGGNWIAAGTGATTDFGVGSRRGYAMRPQLASAGGSLHLVWNDNFELAQTGQLTRLYARYWSGTLFVDEFFGESAARGISVHSADSSNVALAVDSQGQPWVAWQENGTDSSEIFAQTRLLQAEGLRLIADDETTVQELLDTHALGPGDEIRITNAVQPGFTVMADDSGVRITSDLQIHRGSIYEGNGITPTIDGPVIVDGAVDVTLGELWITGGLIIDGSDGVHVSSCSVGPEVTLRGDTDTTITGSFFNRVIIDGSTGAKLAGNFVGGGLVTVEGSGATDLLIEGSEIRSGLALLAPATGNIRGNHITGSHLTGGVALSIDAPFTGMIEDNDITKPGNNYPQTGVAYHASATLSGNRIFGNTVGIEASVAGVGDSLGSQPGSLPNEIHDNGTGVLLSGGWVQNQRISHNVTGIVGQGDAGETDLSTGNWVARNNVGIDISGDVKFNRLTENSIGIVASSGALVAHNVLDMNTDVGLVVNGSHDVRIHHNTIVGEDSTNIRISGGASEVEILSNIVSTDNGIDIDVADNSQAGFFSDYNSLHAGTGGVLVHWLFDFTDILDWQEDVHQYDLHSVGSTVINPNWAKPRFQGAAIGDLRLVDLVAGQRISGPQVDAAHPAAHLTADWPYENLLINPTFESSLSNWTVDPGAGTKETLPSNCPFSRSVTDEASGWV